MSALSDSEFVRQAPVVRPHLLLLAIAYLGFISLGLPDPVAGVAWPSVRDAFGLQQSQFGWVLVALASGYCSCSFLGGRLTQWLGVGWLLTASSALVALAMFGSGSAPSWPLFIVCSVIWGLGSGAIDTGLNGYASEHFSARSVNWLHACYSLGAMLGPWMMTIVLQQGGSWRTGYALVGSVVFAMTLTFFMTRRRWDGPSAPVSAATNSDVTLWHALSERQVWLQLVLFGVYTGLEFAVGQWTFTILTESRGVSEGTAGLLAGGYYGSIGIGRVLFGSIADRVGLDRLVRGTLWMAVVGAVLFAWAPLAVSCAGLVLIGLGLAPFFPCMMARTPQRLGPDLAAHAIGFQVSAAMFGAAVLPGLAGWLAQTWGLSAVAYLAAGLAVLLVGLHETLLAEARRNPLRD